MLIEFPSCTVEWLPRERKCVTRFPDGTEAHAIPFDDDQYRAHAERSGVGTDVDQYCLDHDLAHCWFGQMACGGPSPVLKSVADGVSIEGDKSDREEEIVKLMQAYFNRFGWPKEIAEKRLKIRVFGG